MLSCSQFTVRISSVRWWGFPFFKYFKNSQLLAYRKKTQMLVGQHKKKKIGVTSPSKSLFPGRARDCRHLQAKATCITRYKIQKLWSHGSACKRERVFGLHLTFSKSFVMECALSKGFVRGNLFVLGQGYSS